VAATNNFQYFDNGFLTLNMTGGTAGGKVLLRLTDITLSQKRDIETTTTFDNNFKKVKRSTYYDWSIKADGIVATDSGESEFLSASSADTRIINTYNGLELFELIKNQTNSAQVYLKLATSVYQKGNVIITACDISASSGNYLKYSLQLEGSGDLSLATS
jgi:hypothetical protein